MASYRSNLRPSDVELAVRVGLALKLDECYSENIVKNSWLTSSSIAKYYYSITIPDDTSYDVSDAPFVTFFDNNGSAYNLDYTQSDSIIKIYSNVAIAGTVVISYFKTASSDEE